MRLNYRAANRQAHAGTLGLRREKRLKNLVRPLGRQSYPGITDRDQHLVFGIPLRLEIVVLRSDASDKTAKQNESDDHFRLAQKYTHKVVRYHHLLCRTNIGKP